LLDLLQQPGTGYAKDYCIQRRWIHSSNLQQRGGTFSCYWPGFNLKQPANLCPPPPYCPGSAQNSCLLDVRGEITVQFGTGPNYVLSSGWGESRLGVLRTSMVRMGVCMRGPDPPVMSKGMFMPVRGVRMSEKRMTPSGLNARQGCKDTSTCKSGFCQLPPPSIYFYSSSHIV